jgi:hypothetical protein
MPALDPVEAAPRRGERIAGATATSDVWRAGSRGRARPLGPLGPLGRYSGAGGVTGRSRWRATP